MGGNNVKGLYWMETLFPNPNGQSMIPPEVLQKEIQKGTIVPLNLGAEKNLDGDTDEYVDKVVRDIWNFYDPKGTGLMTKKALQKFFKDALEIYAMRKGFKKGAESMAPGVKSGEAMAQSVAKVTQNPQGCSYQEFENFVNCYDLDEALGSFLNIGEVAVSNNVQFVDTSHFKEEAAKPKAVQYRDYSHLQGEMQG
eukprot:TRINITY_DN21667_c0_g1_i1.p1 TRINITY_DN21667_c0_g1~~TRINITY_DN21667_c0_g1_i1.p1  ORF type:complete len:196 (-),score=58.85 TRINITY_DN21667_c0_g1_i1:126-713(-)